MIGTNILVKLVQGSGQLPGLWTRLGINIQFQALEHLQGFIRVAMPEEPFDPLQLFLELLPFVFDREQFGK